MPFQRASLLMSVAAGALVAGCAHYTPKPLSPESTLRTFESRRLTDEAVLKSIRTRTGASGEPAARPVEWDRGQLLLAALELNPTLSEARASLAQTRAGLRSARELQNPTASLSSEYDLSKAGESPWLWGLATSVLLDTFASRNIRIDLAQAGIRGAVADFNEAVWTVRHDLRAALLSVTIASRRVSALARDAQLRTDALRLTRARVAAGEGARPDSLQAELELARSQSALDDARGALADSNAKLAAALGVPVAALSGLTPQWPDIDSPQPVPESTLASLRERALLSRATMTRAIADYDARELDLKQQMSAQYLQVSLGPGYTYDHGVRKLTFGGSIALPIFNRNEGPIAAAYAARETAGQHVLAAQAGILAAVESATATYSNALEALTRIREQRVASEQLARSQQRALEIDATDRPTALTAELAASTERLAELDALDRAQQALGALEDALHAPVAGPETRLNLTDDTLSQRSERP
jgi:outer membrane protein, heavy metal efflux system